MEYMLLRNANECIERLLIETKNWIILEAENINLFGFDTNLGFFHSNL